MEALPMVCGCCRNDLLASLPVVAQHALSTGDRGVAIAVLAELVSAAPSPAVRWFYAVLLSESGLSEGAAEQLELAWEEAKREDSPVWRAHCCHALADLHRQAGRVDLTNRYRQWAIRAELDAGPDVSVSVWRQDRAADGLPSGGPITIARQQTQEHHRIQAALHGNPAWN